MFFKLFLAVFLVVFGILWVVGVEEFDCEDFSLGKVQCAIVRLISLVLACLTITGGIMVFLRLLK